MVEKSTKTKFTLSILLHILALKNKYIKSKTNNLINLKMLNSNSNSYLFAFFFFFNELQCASKQASVLPFDPPLSPNGKRNKGLRARLRVLRKLGTQDQGLQPQQTEYGPSHSVKSTEARRN